MDYKSKEIELALSYINGELNETQLNFLCVQNNFDLNKIKDLSQELVRYATIMRNVFLGLVFLVVFLFSLWFMRG